MLTKSPATEMWQGFSVQSVSQGLMEHLAARILQSQRDYEECLSVRTLRSRRIHEYRKITLINYVVQEIITIGKIKKNSMVVLPNNV